MGPRLDPSTELAPFTAARLQTAMDGSHPPKLVSNCRVVSVEENEQNGSYIVTAVKTSKALDKEILSLPVQRSSTTGFGVFLETSIVVVVGGVDAGGPADQAGFKVHDVVVEVAGVQVEGRVPHGLVEAMDRVKALSARGQDVFQWKLRREPKHAATPADDADVEDSHCRQNNDTVRVKTSAKPVLATGFNSGVGEIVNHLFVWTEEALCSSDSDTKSEEKHPHGHAHAGAAGTSGSAEQAGTAGADSSSWTCSDTQYLLEHHAADVTPRGGVADLIAKYQLAEAAKAELERELPEAICAGGQKAAVATVMYETLCSNVESLRDELAAAQADTQAPAAKVARCGSVFAPVFARCVLAPYFK